MTMSEPNPRRIAVLGGGIAGLAASHRLVELSPECRPVLLEAGSRVGGVLSTVHQSGFQIEQSADNFITTLPWGIRPVQAAGPYRAARANESRVSADLCGPGGPAAPIARRVPYDGPDAHVATGR